MWRSYLPPRAFFGNCIWSNNSACIFEVLSAPKPADNISFFLFQYGIILLNDPEKYRFFAMLKPNKVNFMKSHKWICPCASREAQDTTHFVRCFRKTAKSLMSVCPSLRRDQPYSHWTGFHEIWYLSIFFENLWRKSSLDYNLIWITSNLHEAVCRLVIRSPSILLRIRTVSVKSCTEYQNRYFRINNILPKIVPFMRMWENMVQPDSTQTKI